MLASSDETAVCEKNLLALIRTTLKEKIWVLRPQPGLSLALHERACSVCQVVDLLKSLNTRVNISAGSQDHTHGYSVEDEKTNNADITMEPTNATMAQHLCPIFDTKIIKNCTECTCYILHATCL